MNREAVFHQILSEYAYPIDKDRVVIKLRCTKKDACKVEIVYIDKYKYIFDFMDHLEDTFKTEKMDIITADSDFDYFGIELDFRMIAMAYYFKI